MRRNSSFFASTILCMPFIFCYLPFITAENKIAAKECAPYAEQLPVFEELDLTVKEALDVFKVPGVAIGIVIDGKVALTKGYGYRDIEQQLPVTENTLFGIGSCTKAFTTFILGQLVNEGKITWDDPVILHIPEFRLLDIYTTHHTTIKDLVAHRSGLAPHDFLWFKPDLTRQDIINSLGYLEPAFPLREKFLYNNLMFNVAGIVIERVTGQLWEKVVFKRIFNPLSMHYSNCSVEESKKNGDYSLPYLEVGGRIKRISFFNMHAGIPAGGINSNVSDMVKWIQLQLSTGSLFNHDFIAKEILNEMHTIQIGLSTSTKEEKFQFGYGLGWRTGIYRGHYYVDHNGEIDGFVARVFLLPEQNTGFVVLSNSNNGSNLVEAVTNSIADQLLGKNDIDWIKKMKNKQDEVNKESLVPAEEHALQLQPSHRVEEYVGNYEHPAYGKIVITLKNNKLSAAYGEICISLSPKCYDIFEGTIEDALSESKVSIDFSFSSNISGTICELLIPLDSSVKPILFKKEPVGTPPSQFRIK
jgi:CubicO group peptidase (beta-lactamase class C family)